MHAPDLGPAPSVPDVDANIGRKDLRYDALVEAVRRQNWACAKRKKRKALPVKRSTEDGKSIHSIFYQYWYPDSPDKEVLRIY